MRFNFSNMAIDEALRKFLSCFRLPGEADQIDRIIEKFSASYRHQHPQYKAMEKEMYLLAYSLIMLNTLNHNPRVNEKMKFTVEAFVKQCKDVAPEYPEAEFEKMFHRIYKQEFKTDTQDVEQAFERIGPFFNLDLD